MLNMLAMSVVALTTDHSRKISFPCNAVCKSLASEVCAIPKLRLSQVSMWYAFPSEWELASMFRFMLLFLGTFLTLHGLLTGHMLVNSKIFEHFWHTFKPDWRFNLIRLCSPLTCNTLVSLHHCSWSDTFHFLMWSTDSVCPICQVHVSGACDCSGSM